MPGQQWTAAGGFFLSLAIPNLTWITQDALSLSPGNKWKSNSPFSILNLCLFSFLSRFSTLSLVRSLFSRSVHFISRETESYLALDVKHFSLSLTHSLSLLLCSSVCVLFHLVFYSFLFFLLLHRLHRHRLRLSKLLSILSGCRKMYLCDLAWCQLAKYLPPAT